MSKAQREVLNQSGKEGLNIFEDNSRFDQSSRFDHEMSSWFDPVYLIVGRPTAHSKRKKRKVDSCFSYSALEPRVVLNAAPVANDDLLYFTSLNSAINGNLVSNDFDAEGNSLTASLVGSAPSSGQLVINPNGSFTFTPNNGFTGTASWEYQVNDGTSFSLSARAQVLVGTGLSGPTERGLISSSNPLQTGAQTLIQSLGHGKKLIYRGDHQGRAIVQVTTFAAPGMPTPTQISASLTFNGQNQGTVNYSPSGFATGPQNLMRFATQVENIPTGYYDWTMTVTMSGSGWSHVKEFHGSQAVVNRQFSEYRPGWWLEGQDRIYINPNGSNGAMLVEGGGGSVHWFQKNGSVWERAEGDNSYGQLTQDGVGYRVTDKWGNYRKFDSAGRITSVHEIQDLSTPSWTYEYNALGQLLKMTDHADRMIEFEWSSNMLVACQFFPAPGQINTDDTETILSLIDPITQEFTVTEGQNAGAPSSYSAPLTRYRYDGFRCAVMELPSLEPNNGPLAKRTYDFDSFGLLSAIHFHNLGNAGTEIHTVQISPMLKQGLRPIGGLQQPLHFVANDQAHYEDERDKVWSFKTDRFGQVTRWVTPLQAITEYEYDQRNGELYRYTGADPDLIGPESAPIINFGYSGLGNLVTQRTIGDVNTPTSTLTWTYHSSLNLPITATNELGKTETMTYRSSTGSLLSYTDRQSLVWTFAYDEDTSNPPGGAHGRLRSVTSPDPDGPSGPLLPTITSYEYGNSINYRLVTKIINPDSSFQLFSYGEWDVLGSVKDEKGISTVYTRDPLNRVTRIQQGTLGPVYEADWKYEFGKHGQLSKQIDPLGKETTFTYDARYRMLTQTLPDPDGADWLPSPVYSWKYNPTGQVIEAHDPSYASGYNDLFEYDNAGRMTKHTGPLHTQYPSSQETIYQYDLLDRLVRTKDASGRVERWKYDIRGRLDEQFPSDPDDAGPLTGPSVKYSYDAASRLIAVRDEIFRQTDYQYTDNHWLFKTILPDPDLSGPQARSTWEFNYDNLGRRTKIKDPLNRETTLAYNNRNWVASVTTPDPDGGGSLNSLVYSYEYDLVGNIETITLPLAREIDYEYDNLHRVKSVQLPMLENGQTPMWLYNYDAVGNLKDQQDPFATNGKTEFEYDGLHRLKKVIQPRPDGLNGVQARPEWNWNYNERSLLSSTTDPLGRTTLYGHDFGGRMSSMQQPGDTKIYTYQFDALDRLTKVISPDPVTGSASSTSSETSYSYDSRSRLSQVVSSVSATVNSTTSYRWNDASELTGLTDTLGNLTQWSYDRAGRRVLETNSLGHSRATGYDLNGNQVRSTDRNGRIVKYSFDTINRLTEEKWYSHSTVPTASVQTITPGSSTTNEVQRVSVSGLTAANPGKFTLGFKGSTTREINHDASATVVRDALIEAVPFFNASNLSVSLNVLGNGTREYTITFNGSNGNQDQPILQAFASFTNDPANALRTLEYAFDQGGRLGSTTDRNAASQILSQYGFVYDSHNQVRFETSTVAGLVPQVKLERTYDLVGNRKSLEAEFVNGSNVTKDYQNDYSFDSLYRLTQIKQTSQGSGSGFHAVQNKRVDFNYNKLGQFTSINRWENLAGTGDKLDTVYSYDTSNRLEVLSHQRNNGGSILSNYQYAYDRMNRIKEVNHTVGAGSGGSADGLSLFSYDRASQLTAADHAPPRPDEGYQFDANGNRTGGAIQNGGNNQTVYDGTYTYHYDKEGNRVKRKLGAPGSETDSPFEEYSFDHRNRLTQVKKFQSESSRYYDFVNYTYDSFNRMIKRQTGTYDTRNAVNTLTRDQYFTGYEGINATLEFETSGTSSAPAATEVNLKHRYLWGPNVDQLLADEQYGAGTGGASSPSAGVGNTLWALADHLGTIRSIADFGTAANPGAFSIVNHRVFDSFGNLTSQTSASTSASISFRYTGKFFDDLTGLSHHWNRWYDPKLGKWISEDPIGFAGGDTNLSRYVWNRSNSNTDSAGLFGDDPWDKIARDWILELIDEASGDMIGWKASNPKDKGSFGTAVSDIVREKLASENAHTGITRGIIVNSGPYIYYGVLVDKDTKIIKELGASKGTPQLVEVDILVSQNPISKGSKFDGNTMNVWELKATEDGYVRPRQAERLKSLTPNVTTVRTSVVWDRPNNIVVENSKVKKLRDMMGRLGIILPFATILWPSDVQAKYNELNEVVRYPGQIFDPEDRKSHRIRVMGKIKELAEALGADSSDLADGAFVIGVYGAMNDDLFDKQFRISPDD